MKKAIALIMAMMMVSSFAACNKTEEKPATPATEDPITPPGGTGDSSVTTEGNNGN